MPNNPQQAELIYKLQPGSQPLQGTVVLPGDKSISHRAVILGALAEGVTEINGFLNGADCVATLQALRAMGVNIEGPQAGRVLVHGVGLRGLQPATHSLDLGNSGTSMRLLSGVLAGQAFTSTLTGDASLLNRPMNRIADPLCSMGAEVITHEGKPPLQINGHSPLQALNYQMPVASAQVKSCLLLAGLYAEGETVIQEVASTRDHTERMLAAFSYPIRCEEKRISLAGQGKLQATQLQIPADISAAAFFMVGASIQPGAEIILPQVGINPTRLGIVNLLRQMGAKIELAKQRKFGNEPVADIHVSYAPLHGIEIPLDQVPLAIDEFPALFIAAACAKGKTVLRGAKELRIKESDRIIAMAEGLTTVGIATEVLPDGLIVAGGTIGGGEIASYHDHRIAMAFAMAALRATAPITIRDCANVATSFPNFVAIAQQLGLLIEEK